MVREVAGRYAIGPGIASGGMATVHLGRMVAAGGFARTVAIKRLHPRYAKDPEFVSMFLDEARLAARAPHPNVVSALDVVTSDDEVILVMEYVRGESVAWLLRVAADAGEEIPLGIALAVISGVLSGLHAAHEATTDRGEPLGIVHRDVSPQNVLVGTDGVARVLDFGIAKAKYRLHSTKDGRIKGKLRYIAPEQLRRDDVDRRSDVYSASIVLWEMLTGRTLFAGEDPASLVERIRAGTIAPPRTLRPSVPEAIDAIVMRGLAEQPGDRFPTALAMAEALERAGTAASPREVGAWVLEKARATLDMHAAAIVAMSEGADGGERGAGSAGESLKRGRSRADSRVETEIVADGADAPRPLFDTEETATDTDASPPLAPSPPPRRSRVVYGIGMAVVAVGLTTCGLVASTANVATPPGSEATHVASASLPPTASGASVEPEPDPEPASAASATTVGSSAAPRSSGAPSRRPRVVKPARAGCDPPYFIDSEGHKQYHPKCL